MNDTMSSLERVLRTINHKEPDRVPLFLMLTHYGAKELDMTIKKYFSRAENVVKAQINMQDKYRNDCFYTHFYAAVQVEAMGGEVIYTDDGPPNAGEPVIRRERDILNLELPIIKEAKCLHKVLEAIACLRKTEGSNIPILGTVVSPFSLPVMQMGFDKYIELIYERPDLFNHLMAINEEFCVQWANAQLSAGATAIGYFNPVASSMIIPPDLYCKTGYITDKRSINKINGPVTMALASTPCTPILDYIIETGVNTVTVSYSEDIGEVKKKAGNKLALLGNLNGIQMAEWSKNQAENAVKDIIRKSGRGGGLIISENSSEIPIQVPESVLLAISEGVSKWGKYPLDWID
jgi:uroporphyrinogen decarboxylase